MPTLRRLAIAGLAFAICSSVGCTHMKLRRSASKQSFTTMKIYEQQVLDNLAMFTVNGYAIPSFSTLSQGSSDVSDKGTLSMSPLDEFREKVGLSIDRTVGAGWNLLPVHDTHKLELMRCAYQHAVGLPTSGNCPNCCKLEAKFEGKDYLGDSNSLVHRLPTIGTSLLAEETNGDQSAEALPAAHPTKETQSPAPFICNECRCSCWFKTAQHKRDIPDNCCELVGEFCGQYVYVPNNSTSRDQFARLVLRILDYALHDGHGSVKVIEVTSKIPVEPTNGKSTNGESEAGTPGEERPTIQFKQTATVPLDFTVDEIKTALGLQGKAGRGSRALLIEEVKQGPMIQSAPPAFLYQRDFDRQLRTLGLPR